MRAQFRLIIKYVAGLRWSTQERRIARIKYAISNLFKRRVINSCLFPLGDSGKIVKIHGNDLTSSPEPVTKLGIKAFRGDRNSNLFKGLGTCLSRGYNEEKNNFENAILQNHWASFG